ncbi:hypothetical protein LRAMOSA00391 [Lichtheimia ramosa]|uniref:Uncharacterized protein n=1 Tax=Lichtheimia ramosa TaxID=688394 RepID=A0A077W8V8_9FUNG|nr:hypothetical protein LRAMOSA00391 [Lichtheimia ramosa]
MVYSKSAGPSSSTPPPSQSFHNSTSSSSSSSPACGLQYMDNVMSRFGHHLSAHQRTSLSQSMVPNLQSGPPTYTHYTSWKTAAGTSMPHVNNHSSNNTANPISTLEKSTQQTPCTTSLDTCPRPMDVDKQSITTPRYQ